jgi:hypothetical protein
VQACVSCMREVASRGGSDGTTAAEERGGRGEAVRMIDEAELRLMSPEQRARLARTLAALDLPKPKPFNDQKFRTRRNIALIAVLACCIFLAVWIGVLAVTLPSRHKTGDWRGTWVGFDVAELMAFAAVGWTAWRGKQLLIVCLVITSTLLCCDAWFDLTLDWGNRTFYFSVLSAVFVELPLAALMALGARRVLRLTIAAAMAQQGDPRPVPPLWRIPLVGAGRSVGDRRAQAAASEREPAGSDREPAASAREPAGSEREPAN